ncbi:MAG: hypothetical protein KDK27_08255 [Leptospiraceae bacterium]|nr:hypothetical protein [Leptospiraceae bacterium]
MLTLERGAWELKNERNKKNVRWLLIILIGGYLAYILHTDQGNEIGATGLFNWLFIGILMGVMAFLNLMFSIYLRLSASGRIRISPVLKYITMFVDFGAVSIVLIPTGGDESMFFVVYFIVIVSNSLRYGMRLTIIGLLMFNLLYVGVLAYQYPDLIAGSGECHGPHCLNFQREVLKVSVFWVVGLYTGYIARRFEILQGEVEKYERLVERLMARRDDELESGS